MRAAITAWLAGLEREVAPMPGQHHTLHIAEYVTGEGDTAAVNECLCIVIAKRVPVTLVVAEDDFAKPMKQLGEEIRELVNREAAKA